MTRYGVLVLLIAMMAVTAVLAGACRPQPGGTQQQVGKMQRESQGVDLKNAKSARTQLKMGAGESDLDLDSLALTGVDLQMGAGKTTVDLTGDYAQSFDASIQGGVGEATVLLPSEVGVKAKAEGGPGKINAEGLKRVGNSYVNDAYGESDVNLSVDVQGGIGQINLEVV
jgi:predicted membrane protein